MRLILLLCLFFTLGHTSIADDDASPKKAYPKAKKLEDGRYDLTDRWQAMFGLDGKLTVKTAIRDESMADADGFVESTLVVVPTVAGWYTFTFIKVDMFGHVLQVRTDAMEVTEAEVTRKPPVIDPDDRHLQQAVFVPLNAELRVHWSFYPGGEGPIGGWLLHTTAFIPAPKPDTEEAFRNFPPSVPGYEGASGE